MLVRWAVAASAGALMLAAATSAAKLQPHSDMVRLRRFVAEWGVLMLMRVA